MDIYKINISDSQEYLWMAKTLNLSYQYMSSFSRPKSGAYMSVTKDWYTLGT